MPVDLDAPTRAGLRAFGDVAQTGKAWTYTPKGAAPFDLDAIYDEAWATIEIRNTRFSMAPVSTTKPCILVRLADFPAGLKPAQFDTVVRNSTCEAYEIADVNEDGFGCAHLPLNDVT